MKLFIFNPESDLALGQNSVNYTPSKNIRKMMDDVAALPIWLAMPGDVVLVPNYMQVRHKERSVIFYRLGAEFVTLAELRHLDITEICPWGWNLTLRHQLLCWGVKEELLPTEEELAKLRQLSSRVTATEVLQVFKDMEMYCTGLAENCTDVDSCRLFAEQHPEGVVYKSPWSSSGKGLCWCKGEFTEKIQHWCERVLRTQGTVIAQTWEQREMDFAMEFYSDGQGHYDFVGYSLFETSPRGAYQHHYLMNDKDILESLSQFVPKQAILSIKRRLLKALSQYTYKGYMGVDMMIVKNPEDGTFKIHPCVEINWRMNFGVFCHQFQERLVGKHSKGVLRLVNFKTPKQLQEYNKTNRDELYILKESNRFVEGYTTLTPILPDTQAAAVIFLQRPQERWAASLSLP